MNQLKEKMLASEHTEAKAESQRMPPLYQSPPSDHYAELSEHYAELSEHDYAVPAGSPSAFYRLTALGSHWH